MNLTCPRCGGPCEPVERSPNVIHYTCADTDCEPYRPPRWLFALGICYELCWALAMAPVALARWAWRKLME